MLLFNNFFGMSFVEYMLLNIKFLEKKFVELLLGSGFKLVVGDVGLLIFGYMIEMLCGGLDYLMFLYKMKGLVVFGDLVVLLGVVVLGFDVV